DGDLLGAQVLAHQGDALGGAEDALDGADGALLVEVLLGLLAERQAAVAAHGDDRGRPLLSLVVGHDLGLAELEVGDDRVAGPEVDPDVRHELTSAEEEEFNHGTHGKTRKEEKTMEEVIHSQDRRYLLSSSPARPRSPSFPCLSACSVVDLFCLIRTR